MISFIDLKMMKWNVVHDESFDVAYFTTLPNFIVTNSLDDAH